MNEYVQESEIDIPSDDDENKSMFDFKELSININDEYNNLASIPETGLNTKPSSNENDEESSNFGKKSSNKLIRKDSYFVNEDNYLTLSAQNKVVKNNNNNINNATNKNANAYLSFSNLKADDNNTSNNNNNGNNNYTTNKKQITQNLLMNKVTKQDISIYTEIKYLMLWNKEETQTVFPEMNILLVIEINDDTSTQIKIPFEMKEESREFIKMTPKMKKNDNSNKSYRFEIKIKNVELEKKKANKFKIRVVNYYKEKFFILGEENLFFSFYEELFGNKFQLYMNMLGYIDNKKIGNLLFNFIYESEDFSRFCLSNSSNCEKNSGEIRDLSGLGGLGGLEDSSKFNSYCNNNSYKKDASWKGKSQSFDYFKYYFPKIDKLSTFKEETDLALLYYNRENVSIKKQSVEIFTSINDIREGKLVYRVK